MLIGRELKGLIFLFLFINSFWLLIAQNDGIKFERITLTDSIKNEFIRLVYQDKKGHLWISVKKDGLLRYNGKEYVYFNKNKKGNLHLPADNVITICEDENEDIYIGSSTGLFFINTREIIVKTILDSNGIELFKNTNITKIIPKSKNEFWVSTENGLFNVKRHVDFYSKEIVNGLFSDNRVTSIYYDEEKTLWVGVADSGLYKFTENSNIAQKVYLTDDKSKFYIYSIKQDANSNLWFATNKGFFKLDIYTNYLKFFNLDAYGLSESYALDIQDDNEGNLWIATGIGLLRFNEQEDVIYRYQFDRTDQYSILSNGILSIAKGINGLLWIGTTEGLCKYNPRFNRIQQLRSSGYHINSIIGQVINCVMEDTKGNLWVGAHNYGLSLILKKDRKVINFREFEVNGKKASNNVKKISEDFDGTIYIATDSGVVVFKNERIQKILHFNTSLGNDINKINDLLIENDLIYFATDEGVVKYNKKNSNTDLIVFIDNINSKVAKTSILIRDKGVFWIGTKRSGFYFYDPIKNIKIQYNEEQDFKESRLNNSFVKSMYLDKNKILWIGHLEGIDMFDMQTGLFRHIEKIDGMQSFIANSILDAGNDNIWIITKRSGLFKLNITNLSITKFDESVGYTSAYSSENGAFRNKFGVLYVSTSDGIAIVNPLNFNQKNLTAPNLVVTSILAKDIRNENNSVLDYSSAYTKFIKLNASLNYLEINYRSLDYQNSENIFYEYKLIGLNKEWSALSKNTKAVFMNLKSGKYVFKVRAYDKSNEWPMQEFSMNVIIKPPFYKTWWFILLMIVVVISIISMIYSFYVSSMQRRQIELENIISERTSALLIQKEEIETQRKEIEIINKDITHSIEYAKNLQTSILPSDSFIRQVVSDYFILFMPQAIVSGDFYWIEPVTNKITFFNEEKAIGDEFYFAAIDCTGHGVPGALMSIIGYMILNQAVKEQGIYHTEEILNYLDQEIQRFLRRSDEGSRDGMDVALCKYNKVTKELEYSGARNNLYIVRNDQLIVLNADKQSIGSYLKDKTTLFERQTYPMQSGDQVYLFTDGFYDQIGGPDYKRLGRKNLLQKIMEIRDFPFSRKSQELRKVFQQWKGNDPQLDDVLIIGIKID